MSSTFSRYLHGALLVVLILAGGGLWGETPPGWFASFESLRLGPSRQSAESKVFALGHARLTFTGRWAPMFKGEQVVGYFLDGSGNLDYQSTHEAEWPVFTRNLKDWTDLVPQQAGQAQKVGVPFFKARLYLLGSPAPAWEGTESAALEESFRAFEGPWQKVDGYQSSHLLGAQMGNAPGVPMAILEMEGKSQRLLYRYDSVNGFEETLDYVNPTKPFNPGLKGWSDLILLSRQYVGWDPRKGHAPIRFQLRELDVDLRSEDNRRVSVVVQETLIPVYEGMSLFTFELMSEIFTEKDTRLLRLTQVTDGSGKPLEFHHSHDRLAVRLPAGVPRGVPLTLRFEYEGDFLIRPRDDSYWQLGVRGLWYPQPQHLAEESYSFHGTVRTKGEWHAFLPGETVRREKDGDWNLVETRTTQPICFATILGGVYFLEEETRGDLTVRIATYAFKPGTASKVIRDQAFNVFATYKPFLGPYPFKEFLIIQKNEWGNGQAPPGMMYITREAFEQISNIQNMQGFADMVGQFGGRANIRTMDVRHVLAHEIAHQYWGTVVKMACPQDQWITESFAEYCSALYERQYKGEGHFKRNVARWKASADFAKDAAPIPLANDLRHKDGYEGFRMRTGLLYAKGPMLLQALHQELGDQMFLTWLKSIQTNFKWKFAPTMRVFELLNFITKKDFARFYETHFWGLSMPPEKP